MRRTIEVGAVLLLLVGCGAGTDQIGSVSQAVEGADPCQEAAIPNSVVGGPMPNLPCQTCGPEAPDDDPRNPVPSTSTKVWATGARKYHPHVEGFIKNALNVKLQSGTGTTIGHVAMGSTKHWITMHVKLSLSTTDARLRIGKYINAKTNQPDYYVATKFGTAAWQMVPIGSFGAYYNSLPVSQQNLIVTGLQAAADTNKQPPPTGVKYGVANEDGTCAGPTWGFIAAGILSCTVPGMWATCGTGIGALTACVLAALPKVDPTLYGPEELWWNETHDTPNSGSTTDGGDNIPTSNPGDNGGNSNPSGGGECE